VERPPQEYPLPEEGPELDPALAGDDEVEDTPPATDTMVPPDAA
jgi:hypothetical protein